MKQNWRRFKPNYSLQQMRKGRAAELGCSATIRQEVKRARNIKGSNHVDNRQKRGEWPANITYPNQDARAQNEKGIIQFSTLIQEDANPPRVGIFMAYPEFVRDHLFLPSKSGPYSVSIYNLGLTGTPLADMETFRRILSRDYIQSPWLECIFSADDNKLRITEQEEINKAILAQTDLDEVLPRILRSLQEEVAALEARRFADVVKKVTKKWWQFWR